MELFPLGSTPSKSASLTVSDTGLVIRTYSDIVNPIRPYFVLIDVRNSDGTWRNFARLNNDSPIWVIGLVGTYRVIRPAGEHCGVDIEAGQPIGGSGGGSGPGPGPGGSVNWNSTAW